MTALKVTYLVRISHEQPKLTGDNFYDYKNFKILVSTSLSCCSCVANIDNDLELILIFRTFCDPVNEIKIHCIKLLP